MTGRSYQVAAREQRGEPVTFTLSTTVDGEPAAETFTCVAAPSVLDMSEMARSASLDANSPEGAAALADFFRTVLGEDYGRFRQLVRDWEIDGDKLSEIMVGVLEDYTARPTGDSAPSSVSQSPSGPTSKVVSLQQGTVTASSA